jgi:hypothetical protein
VKVQALSSLTDRGNAGTSTCMLLKSARPQRSHAMDSSCAGHCSWLTDLDSSAPWAPCPATSGAPSCTEQGLGDEGCSDGAKGELGRRCRAEALEEFATGEHARTRSRRSLSSYLSRKASYVLELRAPGCSGPMRAAIRVPGWGCAGPKALSRKASLKRSPSSSENPEGSTGTTTSPTRQLLCDCPASSSKLPFGGVAASDCTRSSGLAAPATRVPTPQPSP